MSTKNFDKTIGNQTRDLPVCSVMPQPTAPLRGACSTYGEEEVRIQDFGRET
jgi:hypothetical protein